uniref:Uncharacterized protein n=1 Tax=Anopheles quadriannulatus TaxID=34691 RepID=A0A182WUQ4_ANOQN
MRHCGDTGRRGKWSSISSQMDVSKFALDRSAYLNTAAAGALYDTAKSQTNPYSAYLDPTSVLTKAYFDSKMYQDRAQAAANYAFDISKIYGTTAQQQQQQLGSSIIATEWDCWVSVVVVLLLLPVGCISIRPQQWPLVKRLRMVAVVVAALVVAEVAIVVLVVVEVLLANIDDH